MGGDVNPDAVAAHLAALANPLRIRILLALAETRQPDWEHSGMSYSELRTAVGVEDGGRFNYHVDELREQFVRSDAGHYRLTTAGSRVVDEIYAGTFASGQATVSGRLEWTCPADDRQLDATFEEGIVTVSCPTHGVLFDMVLPVGAARNRDLEALFAWANRRALWYLESVSWDVCPHCAGRFREPTICTHRPEPDDAMRTFGWTDSTIVLVELRCRRCDVSFRVPAFQLALTRPPTIAFFHDHGIDYRSLELDYGPASWSCESEARDDGVLVRFAIDDERLEISLDSTLATSSYRRTSVSA